MYAKGAESFDEMTDISKEFREVLASSARLDSLELDRKSISPTDGTTKFLFRLNDGLMIESVLIPARNPTVPRKMRTKPKFPRPRASA